MKSKSSMLVPCHRQEQDGLNRDGSTVAAKRSKKEEASKVVMVAEQVCFPPFDIVADILSRLPVESLLRFRSVCKQWCSLTYDPDFVEDHHKRALDRPALVSQISARNEVSLHHFGGDGEVKRSSFCSKFGKLKHWRFLSNSVNGLVCVSSLKSPYRDDGCFHLLNPSTREVAELPRSASVEGNAKLGLGLDVSTGEYKVARIRPGTSSCEVLSVGTREWRYIGDAPCEVLSCPPLFLNGALHWIVESYAHARNTCAVPLDILAFDLRDERIRVMTAPESWRGNRAWCMGLVASRGQLCFVWRSDPCHEGPGHFLRIWMLRDYTSHEWVKEYDVDVSNFATTFQQFSIIGIRGHKIIIGAHCRGEVNLTVIYSYDFCCGTARELYRGEMRCFGLFTESLVSPRNLVGNLPGC